jgi:hypothetical protein
MFRFWVLSANDLSKAIPDVVAVKAASLGVSISGKNIFTVIREIQVEEGCEACYGDGIRRVYCEGCCWKYLCNGVNR